MVCLFFYHYKKKKKKKKKSPTLDLTEDALDQWSFGLKLCIPSEKWCTAQLVFFCSIMLQSALMLTASSSDFWTFSRNGPQPTHKAYVVNM